jgi:hypothetical protein
MKCMTVTVDDRVMFSGEVAEYQVAESDETITVTARFKAAPTLMDNLLKLTNRQPGDAAPVSNDTPRHTLDVVRDDD